MYAKIFVFYRQYTVVCIFNSLILYLYIYTNFTNIIKVLLNLYSIDLSKQWNKYLYIYILYIS